ncbi:MAG: sulfite exporter TauE/SafE family protein [Clostridiales bacterium]|nr:sulfite exporter TauE/SafE family protein [Clostridiales bacterium]
MKNIFNIKLILLGLIAGFINGLFGAGGGSIIVPALNSFFNVPQHKAQATAISIILPFTIISSFIYYNNEFIVINTTLNVILGSVIGSYFGSKILNSFPDKYLHQIFGIFMILAALRMIF